ncbi:MAG: hypothetical protein ACRC51_10530 [Cetobacterium sp.]
MFGFGRRSEMKEIERSSNSCVNSIENYLGYIKSNLNETISIAKESELPENNILSQKEQLFLDIDKVKQFLDKIKANIKIEGLDIADEIAIDNLELGISECEKMVYSLKNMDIPTSDNLQDYFREYTENYNTAMSSAKLVAGVGALATSGVAIGTTLTLTGLTTTGIVGSSLIGAGSLLGGIGAIAAGPVGWIIGGIGLLSFLGSAPSKEEIAEARRELSKIQRKRDDIYEVYIETDKTLAKAKGVIELSRNFTEIRKNLSSIFKNKALLMEEVVNKNLKENREILEKELLVLLNEEINKLQTYLYTSFKQKKKFFCFRRKVTIWKMIESSNTAEESFNLMNKYFRMPKEYRNIVQNLPTILKQVELSKIEVLPCFDRENSYKGLMQNLNGYFNQKVLEKLRITSPEAKKYLKEVIDFIKLFKNIITTPMVNIEATELQISDEAIKVIEMNKKEIAKQNVDELLKSEEYKLLLELGGLGNLYFADRDEVEEKLAQLQNKYPKHNISFDSIEELIENLGSKIESIFENIENLDLTEDEQEEVGFKRLERQMEAFDYEVI